MPPTLKKPKTEWLLGQQVKTTRFGTQSQTGESQQHHQQWRMLKAPPVNPRTYIFSLLYCNCRYHYAIVDTIFQNLRFATLGRKNKIGRCRPEVCQNYLFKLRWTGRQKRSWLLIPWSNLGLIVHFEIERSRPITSYQVYVSEDFNLIIYIYRV